MKYNIVFHYTIIKNKLREYTVLLFVVCLIIPKEIGRWNKSILVENEKLKKQKIIK